jgi:hypothetical protein
MKNIIGIVLVAILMAGCEKEKTYVTSDRVSLDYIRERGFSLRFKEVVLNTENIYSDENKTDVLRDITINIANILVVNKDNRIGIAQRRALRSLDDNYWDLPYNQMFVDCNKIGMVFDIQSTTVHTDNATDHIYKGTCHLMSEAILVETGKYDIYSGTTEKEWQRYDYGTFQFEMQQGLFILIPPAQYQLGVVDGGHATLPLTGSEVEDIVDNGTQGVDWNLFTRDGVTYVRIGNNLYQRRYDSWVFSQIADPFLPTTWIRDQAYIVFEVEDWNTIFEPYVSDYYEGSYGPHEIYNRTERQYYQHDFPTDFEYPHIIPMCTE